MADGRAGEEKPEKSAAGVMERKVPVAALRSDQLKKKLLQRSPTLDLP
uniref:Uncharacterized protein n=1 Tax=Nomascus leucogenys TaxID=61853 RepID=A0A2I3GTP5_NOMLE